MDVSTLSKLITLAFHADEMKQVYVDLYGKEPELEADTTDAGWLWLGDVRRTPPSPNRAAMRSIPLRNPGHEG